MLVQGKDSLLIVRYAWEDQFPEEYRYNEKGYRTLRQRARDSVIRFALHHGLDWTWEGGWDMAGSRWKKPGGGVELGPIMISHWKYPGDDGVFGWRSIGVVRQ